MILQKHLRWMMLPPDYRNSLLVIHMAWKVERELRILPPIQGRNCLSGGPTTVTLDWLGGISTYNSFDILSVIFGNIVVPPLNTMFE